MTDPWGVPQTSDRPQQDPYGVPPQFGGTVPPQYDPNAAQPGPGFAADAGIPGPYGHPGMPPRPTNGIALAGAIISFVPVVGLVLSVIGRVRAKALGGAGKTAGTVGIVLSILFTGGFGVGAYLLGTSTAADPGCISTEADMLGLVGTLQTDEQAVATAEQSGDASRLAPAKAKFIADMQTVEAELDKSEALTDHASVKAAITKFDTDLGIELEALQSAQPDPGLVSSAESAAERLPSDGTAIDSLCENFTNG